MANSTHSLQLCTVNMEIRELERSTVNLVPEMVFMESDTILVQYILSDWSLQLRSVLSFPEKMIKKISIGTPLILARALISSL